MKTVVGIYFVISILFLLTTGESEAKIVIIASLNLLAAYFVNKKFNPQILHK